MQPPIDRQRLDAEWLETDGRGGYASGTVAGMRTRRYHALLLVATAPPTRRMVLVNGFDAWVTTPAGRFALSSQRYAPGVTAPDGASRIVRFDAQPWPRWVFELEDGTRIEQEILLPQRANAVVVAWRVAKPTPGVALVVRPFLSGRDHHALHHENAAFRFDAVVSNERIAWRLYDGVPGVVAWSNADYLHRPEWYRNFEYDAERDRGLDHNEDLASPGIFSWDLSSDDAVLILGATGLDATAPALGETALDAATRWRVVEKERRTGSRLLRSASCYLVQRGDGQSVIAGYPWFTDWGRDTFIALRGLCLATGQLDAARSILLQWAGAVSEGMLPNRFPDGGESPQYNAVDASLWFIIAVHEFLEAGTHGAVLLANADRAALVAAVDAILDGFTTGTRYRIHCDADGLLAAGEPGVQLTWMDAKVGDWVVTPRIGKPVEVQALWLNALRIGSAFTPRRAEALRRGLQAFEARFWNAEAGCLYDVVDADHRAGAVDASFRPNQIFAIGGLPYPLLGGARARKVVDAVEALLLTPLGLRSLAPDDPAYQPHYQGSARERDAAYHQGTVWPWLIGPFTEAWLRVRGNTDAAKCEARARFLAPLLQHLDEAGLGHIAEIADGEAPHTPRGCPFQAWSLGEVLRLDRWVLAPSKGRF